MKSKLKWTIYPRILQKFFILFLITSLLLYIGTKMYRNYSNKSDILLKSSQDRERNVVALGFFLHPQDYRAGFAKDFSNYNSQATSISINWSQLEPTKGNYKWDTLDTLVNTILSEQSNTKILLHIRSQANWAIEKPCSEYPDAEMQAIHIQDWENFIHKLALRYKDSITMYSLSNEAATPVNWGGCQENPSESYALMLKTMYKAIKKTDPDALVTNDGVSSGLLAYMYGYREIFQKNNVAGVTYFNDVVKHHVPGGFSVDPTVEYIQQMHTGAFGQYAEPFWDMLIENQEYFDVLSLHWYQPSSYLLDIMPWLQKQFPNKPLQLWETAYAWDQNKIPSQTYRGYNLEEQANETAKLLTIGAAYGGLVQLWPWTSRVEDGGKFPVGAVDISTNPPIYKPASAVFTILAEHLNGSTFETLIPHEHVHIFQFTNNNKKIYITWSEFPQTISLPESSQSGIVYDMKGNEKMQFLDSITVTQSPVIITIE